MVKQVLTGRTTDPAALARPLAPAAFARRGGPLGLALDTLPAQPAAVLLDAPFSRPDATLREPVRGSVWQSLRERGAAAAGVNYDLQDVPAQAQRLHRAGSAAGDA